MLLDVGRRGRLVHVAASWHVHLMLLPILQQGAAVLKLPGLGSVTATQCTCHAVYRLFYEFTSAQQHFFAAASLQQDIAVSKIWGLGGKLGAALEQHFQAMTAGQVQAIPLGQLQRVLGQESAAFVVARVNGHSGDAVVPKALPNSINSCKSFEMTSKLATIEMWMVGYIFEDGCGGCLRMGQGFAAQGVLFPQRQRAFTAARALG